MDKIPFSVYDFFGYLASGFILIVVIEHILGVKWLLTADLSAVFTLFWIVIAYIIGHINASIASWLLERKVAGKWLGFPSDNLFNDTSGKWKAKLFPGYFTSFPRKIQQVVKDKATDEKMDKMGESLFIHAFATVKQNENTMARLNSFLNLYGFCRNISVALLFAFVILTVGSFGEGNLYRIPFAIAAFVGSVGMFYRYLKFFRQYSYELFVSYIGPSSTKK